MSRFPGQMNAAYGSMVTREEARIEAELRAGAERDEITRANGCDEAKIVELKQYARIGNTRDRLRIEELECALREQAGFG